MAATQGPPPKMDGMTLVEVTSLLFLGAISLVVLFPAQQQVDHVKQQQLFATQCWENVNGLGKELERYGKTHKGRYPKSLLDLKIANKLAQLPTCPAADPAKGNPYEAGYLFHNLGETAGRYTVRCAGTLHGEVHVPKNQPRFDSYYGMQPTSLDFTKK